jgi:hypothetical protein
MPKKIELDPEFEKLVGDDFYAPAQELVANLPTITEPAPLFERSLWKNTIPILKCVQCESFRNESEKDEFVLHILTHYSDEEEKEAVFNRLLKELN